MNYRQGDVCLIKIEKLPNDLKECPRDEHGRIVLAYGEKTGHAHAIRNPSVCAYSKLDPNDPEYLEVTGGGGELHHELVSGKQAEHDVIGLPKGLFEIPVQVEYTPKKLTRVTD